MKRAQVVRSSPKRRSVLRGLVTGIASVVGLGGVASAEKTSRKERIPVEVKSVDFEMDDAFERLKDVINSPLFRELASEGYLSKQSVDEFPDHRLADDSKPGGVERLQVNGELEQLNFHKSVNGKRLEINLPLSDGEPRAVLHDPDGSSIAYDYNNSFSGEKLDEAGENSSVGTRDHCGGWRYCITCAACCGVTGWQYHEQQIECPNCVIGHCQWVKVGCCETGG